MHLVSPKCQNREITQDHENADSLSKKGNAAYKRTYFARGWVSSYTRCTWPTVNCVYRCVVDSRSCPSIS
jgi:hypothetical protein